MTTDDSRFWKIRRNWAMGAWGDNVDFHRTVIIEKLKQLQFESLLEVGCGPGQNLYQIKKAFPTVHLAGIDINEEAIEYAKTKLNSTQLLVGEANKLPFPDKSFDIILTDAVLIYITSWEIKKVVSELKRVAKKALVLVEWHADEYNKYGEVVFNHWVRDYRKLLGDISLTRVKNWGAEDWDLVGYYIVHKL